MTVTPLYDLQDVTKAYGSGGARVVAVDRLDLRIAPGELVVVAGPSGSGKTTLLQLLGALDRPTEGAVRFEGRDLAALGDGELAALRRETLGFVFQQFNLIPTLTAQQNVEAAIAPTGASSPERRTRAAALLDRVGLAGRAAHLPTQLSGGEQQRVAIARALSVEPRVIFADEPTGNLDSSTGAEVIDILARLAAERGTTVIVATHDAGLAGRAQRRQAMRDGRLAEPATLAANS